MIPDRWIHLVVLAGALAMSGCARDPVGQLADDAVRKKVVEGLVSNPAMRQELVDRLVGAPADRAVVIERILKDESAAGDLVLKILADDHGKALVVSKVTSDAAGARTFIRMLMLTGVMGASLTQKQADALGMGDAFAHGNRRRTMADLRRLGRVIDDWGREHGGRYPVCYNVGEIRSCLSGKLQADRLQAMPLSDAWGTPFQYRTDREGKEYVLLSYAADGAWDQLGKVGPTESFDCDIVFSNGDFVQWPGAIRKDDIR